MYVLRYTVYITDAYSSITTSTTPTGLFTPPILPYTPNDIVNSNPPLAPSAPTPLLPLQSLPHTHRRQSEILANPRNRSIAPSDR